MRIKITNRDEQILQFLEDHTLITSSQIQRIFDMSQVVQSRRMNKLVKSIPNLKQSKFSPYYNLFSEFNNKDLLKNENFYYLNRKPKNVMHEILMNEFYINLIEKSNMFNFEVLKFDCKYTIEKNGVRVKPDAYILIRYDNMEYEYLFELENNKSFNCKKYYLLEKNDVFLPTIIIYTDRRINFYLKNTDHIKIRMNMHNFNDFLDDFMCDEVKKCKEKCELNCFLPCNDDTVPF